MHNTSMMNDFPYLYRGVVLENNDPKHLGRCKVKVPSVHGSRVPSSKLLPWARCLSSSPVSKNRSSAIIPDIGDIVWIFFEGGDLDSPVYIGGTYGTPDIPINLDEVVIYQEDNHRIVYDRVEKSYTVSIGDTSLRIDSLGNLDIRATSDIGIKSDGKILLSSKEVSFEEVINIIGLPIPQDILTEDDILKSFDDCEKYGDNKVPNGKLLSETYSLASHSVKTVNGTLPDVNGDVKVSSSEIYFLTNFDIEEIMNS